MVQQDEGSDMGAVTPDAPEAAPGARDIGPAAPMFFKQRRVREYRLGSGQVRAYERIEHLELVATQPRKEWRINEVVHKNVFR